MQKLGIVAGAGGLPVLLAKMAVAKGITPVIITLDGQECADFAPLETKRFGLTQIESIISYLQAQEVSDLVMAGKVERPVITSDTIIDATSAELLKKTLPQGDDAALRAVLAVIQQAGLRVLPLQALMPDHKLEADYHNGIGDKLSEHSLSLAVKAHKRLSALDVGQSVIVQDSRVIAIEAAEGTDEMIRRASGLLSPQGQSVFFKASKTTQHKLLDPPVIGLDTIQNCLSAGIDVIAIEAEYCLLAAPLAEIEALCAAHDIRFMSVTVHEAGA